MISLIRCIVALVCAFLFSPTSIFAQVEKKYQSLMWEISGNELAKPSYIYGTMHISGKMVFHLGEPFYDAMKSVDVLALELEPEAWLQAIFDDKHNQMWQGEDMRSGEFGYDWNNSDLPSLEEYYKLQLDLQDRIRMGLMYNPELLNYLLYRFGSYGYGADYEEDTWLDMYLYQTGKKMGKRTIGLETYAQSDAFYKKAVAESRESKDRKYYDTQDREEMAKMGEKMETAYRTQDLDLIDSLNKKTTDKAFDKYILIERNKVFVHCMDSVLKAGQTIFAGMGCAHLPGDSGVIEMLREIGYVIKPFNKGARNVKTREKIDASVYKRSFQKFTSSDGELEATAPHVMYELFQSDDASAMISLDIPNAASFMIFRMKSFAGLKDQTPEKMLASIDSILYEVVAGDIVSQKRITKDGFQGIELYNKNRRGDIHRKQIFITPEEIVIFLLTSSGDKVKRGYGNEFFASIRMFGSKARTSEIWTSQDQTMQVRIPGELRYYKRDFERFESPDFAVTSADSDGAYYVVQRHTISDPEFFDEDSYETNRLMNAFIEDNQCKENHRRVVRRNGRNCTQANFQFNQRNGYAMAVLDGLNYCLFAVFADDSTKANSFFDSVKFLSDRHLTYYPYSDTTYHYKVEMPFDYKASENFGDYGYFDEEDAEVNHFESITGSGAYAVPGHAPVILLEFKRSHAFSDPDSSNFINTWREELIDNAGFLLMKYKLEETQTGLIANFIYGDTACSRVNWTRKILHHKSLYTLTSTYDSLTGPGEFITHFYQSFVPLDSTYKSNHFENKDQLFLDSLASGSLETRRQLAELLDQVDLDAKYMGQVREMYNNMPVMKDEDDQNSLKKFLIDALAADTSEKNIKFIQNQFEANTDSSKIQILLLRELLEMNNKRAYQAYQNLLLNDPPVTGSGNGTFDLLYDSLALAVPLVPSFFNLMTLEEYEMPTYRLIATMLDSNLVAERLYEKQLAFLVLEAKNELKRLNSTTDLSYYSFYPIVTYLRLLLPFKNKPEVKQIFDKAMRIKNQEWALEYLTFQAENDIVPSDSLIRKVMTKKELITELYGVLHKEKMTQYWPAEMANRDTLVLNYLSVRFNNKYNKKAGIDTTFIYKKEIRVMKGREFEVFYLKYKMKEASSWLGMIVAFDNTDPKNLWPNVIESGENIVIDSDENDEDEFKRAMRLMEESNRRQWRWKNSYNQFIY